MLDDTHMYCQSQTTTMQETNTMTLTNTMCSDMRHMDVHTYIFIFSLLRSLCGSAANLAVLYPNNF